jgi:hypothetical protein
MYWIAGLLFLIGLLAYGYSVSNQVKVAPSGGCNSCPKNNGNMSM